MTHDQAIAFALALFVENYRDRFPVGTSTARVWGEMLSDLEPQEIEHAARSWISRSKWPPTVADLREQLPRFCRCGRCHNCNRRAIEGHKRALEGSSGGYSADPFDIEIRERRQLEQRRTKLLQQAAQQRRIGQ